MNEEADMAGLSLTEMLDLDKMALSKSLDGYEDDHLLDSLTRTNEAKEAE
jgi:hypothetical protein